VQTGEARVVFDILWFSWEGGIAERQGEESKLHAGV
jgi:hypothetical protein